MRRVGLIGIGIALVATPAAAQDDWDLDRDPERKLTVATVTLDNFSVAVRCLDDVMSVLVVGLPPGRGVRTIHSSLDGQPLTSDRWISANRTTHLSVWPAAMAAQLSKGGRWVLDVPDGDRVHRTSVDLPTSSTEVREVFRACGRELTPASFDDEPGEEDLGPLVWTRAPRPSYPRTEIAAGLAALTCTVDAAGRLRACRIESEFPEGGGFGRAAAIGAHRTGWVAPQPDTTEPSEGRQISFTVQFNMGDEAPFPVSLSRLPASPERTGRTPPAAD